MTPMPLMFTRGGGWQIEVRVWSNLEGFLQGKNWH